MDTTSRASILDAHRQSCIGTEVQNSDADLI